MAAPSSQGSRAFNPWPATITLLVANFMNLMDVTIVNVALPVMQRQFGASASQIEWVAAGYTLVFALGLLPLGRMGDILGHKRLFLTGVVLFTATSPLWGPAPSVETLGLATAQNLFPPQPRARADTRFGLWALHRFPRHDPDAGGGGGRASALRCLPRDHGCAARSFRQWRRDRPSPAGFREPTPRRRQRKRRD